jgi:sulfur carrier protein
VKLIVNGKDIQTEAKTIKDLLKELNIEKRVMASAVNMNVIKKEEWETFKLKDEDKIEFIQFVGGG